MRLLESADAAHQFVLHIEGQAGGDAVGVHLVSVQTLGLDEDLMRALVREAHDLVFHRRAVARTYAFNHAGEQGRAIGGLADDVVCPLIRRSNETIDLSWMVTAAPE